MAKVGIMFLLKQDWSRTSLSSLTGIGVAVDSKAKAESFKGNRNATEYDYEIVDIFDNSEEAMTEWEAGRAGTRRGLVPLGKAGGE